MSDLVISAEFFDALVPLIHELTRDENGTTRIKFYKPIYLTIDTELIKQYFEADTVLSVSCKGPVYFSGTIKDQAVADYFFSRCWDRHATGNGRFEYIPLLDEQKKLNNV